MSIKFPKTKGSDIEYIHIVYKNKSKQGKKIIVKNDGKKISLISNVDFAIQPVALQSAASVAVTVAPPPEI